jgi:hypothetical protein
MMDLVLLVQSLSITTKVVSSIPTNGQVYSMHYYVIKFVSYSLQVGSLSPDTTVSFTNKLDCHIITEILMKVALNTHIQTFSFNYC